MASELSNTLPFAPGLASGSADPASPPIAGAHSAEGGHDAVQDDRSRVAAGPAGSVRAAAQHQEAASGTGYLRDRPESQPRGVDPTASAGPAGQRSAPDRERSPGDRDPEPTGPFALRILEGRNGAY